MFDETREKPAEWWFWYALSLYVTYKAVVGLFVPARELGFYPYYFLFLDMGLAAVVILMGIALGRREDGPDWMRTMRPLMLILGGVSGVTVVAIRLFSSNGWWSGHIHCCG